MLFLSVCVCVCLSPGCERGEACERLPLHHSKPGKYEGWVFLPFQAAKPSIFLVFIYLGDRGRDEYEMQRRLHVYVF